jgi:poly(3-hydroxybutyrate) depolymerase
MNDQMHTGIAEATRLTQQGHLYPGSYTDPRGPDASAEMVRFFEQHHKR